MYVHKDTPAQRYRGNRHVRQPEIVSCTGLVLLYQTHALQALTGKDCLTHVSVYPREGDLSLERRAATTRVWRQKSGACTGEREPEACRK